MTLCIDKTLSSGQRKRIELASVLALRPNWYSSMSRIPGGIIMAPSGASPSYQRRVRVHPHGRYVSDFSLTSGRVGKLQIDYAVEANADAITELNAKIFERGDDDIRIREEVVLSGAKARSLIRTRVVLEGCARAEVTGITEGNAERARGHVDCISSDRQGVLVKPIPR